MDVRGLRKAAMEFEDRVATVLEEATSKFDKVMEKFFELLDEVDEKTNDAERQEDFEKGPVVDEPVVNREPTLEEKLDYLAENLPGLESYHRDRMTVDGPRVRILTNGAHWIEREYTQAIKRAGRG